MSSSPSSVSSGASDPTLPPLEDMTLERSVTCVEDEPSGDEDEPSSDEDEKQEVVPWVNPARGQFIDMYTSMIDAFHARYSDVCPPLAAAKDIITYSQCDWDTLMITTRKDLTPLTKIINGKLVPGLLASTCVTLRDSGIRELWDRDLLTPNSKTYVFDYLRLLLQYSLEVMDVRPPAPPPPAAARGKNASADVFASLGAKMGDLLSGSGDMGEMFKGLHRLKQ